MPPAASHKKEAWLVGGAVAVGVVGVAAAMFGLRTREVPPPPAVPAVIAPVAMPALPVEAKADPQRAAPGIIMVRVNVPEAHIELDGHVVATAAQGTRITVEQPGDHELLVSAPGRRTLTKMVTVTPGSTVDLNVKLERAKAAAHPNGDYLVDPFGNPQ
jgi:hypothetical protein